MGIAGVTLTRGPNVSFSLSTYNLRRMQQGVSTVPAKRDMEAFAHAHIARKYLPAQWAEGPDYITRSFSFLEDKEETLATKARHEAPDYVQDELIGSCQRLDAARTRSVVFVQLKQERGCSCGPEEHDVITPYQPPCWKDGTDDLIRVVREQVVCLFDNLSCCLVDPRGNCIYVRREDLLPPKEHPNGALVKSFAEWVAPRAVIKAAAAQHEADGVATEGVDEAGIGGKPPVPIGGKSKGLAQRKKMKLNL